MLIERKTEFMGFTKTMNGRDGRRSVLYLSKEAAEIHPPTQPEIQGAEIRHQGKYTEEGMWTCKVCLQNAIMCL